MADLSWGGFNNGRIPTNLLTLVRGEPFRSDAAAQLLKFEAAFKAEFGHEFIIAEGYRPLERQKILRAAYLAYLAGTGPWAPIANYVGHSVHGWGLAADLWSGINTFGTSEHGWAVKNGPRFGWYWGSTPSEAWHFEFHPTGTFASVDATPIQNAAPTPEEDDLMATPEQRRELINELLNFPAYDGGPALSVVLKNTNAVYDALFQGGPSTPGAQPLTAIIGGTADAIRTLPADVSKQAWWTETVRRGDQQVPTIQELADIKTILIRLEAALQPDHLTRMPEAP